MCNIQVLLGVNPLITAESCPSINIVNLILTSTTQLAMEGNNSIIFPECNITSSKHVRTLRVTIIWMEAFNHINVSCLWTCSKRLHICQGNEAEGEKAFFFKPSLLKTVSVPAWPFYWLLTVMWHRCMALWNQLHLGDWVAFVKLPPVTSSRERRRDRTLIKRSDRDNRDGVWLMKGLFQNTVRHTQTLFSTHDSQCLHIYVKKWWWTIWAAACSDFSCRQTTE